MALCSSPSRYLPHPETRAVVGEWTRRSRTAAPQAHDDVRCRRADRLFAGAAAAASVSASARFRLFSSRRAARSSFVGASHGRGLWPSRAACNSCTCRSGRAHEALGAIAIWPLLDHHVGCWGPLRYSRMLPARHNPNSRGHTEAWESCTKRRSVHFSFVDVGRVHTFRGE